MNRRKSFIGIAAETLANSGLNKLTSFGLKNEHDLKLKTPKNAIDIIHSMLNVFYKFEIELKISSMSAEEQRRNLTLSKIINGSWSSKHKLPIAETSPAFTYFLLSTSVEEFHQYFMNFYNEFDQDKSFFLNESEFRDMMNFLCKKENIGRETLRKCFQTLIPATFRNCDKLDKSLEKSENAVLGINLVHGIFELLKLEDFSKDQKSVKPCIEYLKLLPLLVGLYGKLISSKISLRKENLESIRGVDDKGIKLTSLSPSLCKKFERLGIPYDNLNPVTLKYRDIEKALMLFKNHYTDTFGHEQLNLVLKDIQKKYQYSPVNAEFAKPPLLNKSFLNFVSFRICVHGACQYARTKDGVVDKNTVILEYAYWNIVMNERKLDKKILEEKFLKSAKKAGIEGSVTKEVLHQLFSSFATKIFPLISKRIIENVVVKFIEPILTSIPGQTHFDLPEFAEQILDLLNNEAELKLRYYIESCYQQVEEQSPRGKMAGSGHKTNNFTKLARQSSIDKLATIQSETRGDPRSVTSIRWKQTDDVQETQEKSKLPKLTFQDASIIEGLTEPKMYSSHKNTFLNARSTHEDPPKSQQDLIERSLQEIAEKRHSESIVLENRLSVPTKAILKPIPLSTYDDENKNEFRRTLKEFSQNNFAPSQNNLSERKTTGAASEQEILPDYLNSCFIMETFLHNYLYEKSQFVGISKQKNSIPRNLDEIIQPRISLSPEKLSVSRENQQTSGISDSGMRSSHNSSEMRDSIGGGNRRRGKGRGSFKKSTHYDLKNELVDFENFDSDALVFQKKEPKSKKRDGCECNIW